MERLAKRIAGSGVCSRRDAEKLILEGRVTVDGVVVSTPDFNVDTTNMVSVDGRDLLDKPKSRLWGFYKPVGLITTHKDPQGRPTVFERLPSKMPRVVSVGRLDLNSEGLLLLTTDSQISRHAELPTTQWPRYYKVRVFGEVDPRELADLKGGITIDGIHYGRIDAEIDRQSGRNTWLFMTLYEGKNREIREVMRHLGLQVNRLIRVAYGPFQLQDKQPGDLWEISYTEFAKHFPFFNNKADEPAKKTLSLKKPPTRRLPLKPKRTR